VRELAWKPQPGTGIRLEDGEVFERLQERLGRMHGPPFIRTMPALDEDGPRTAPHVPLEHPVRIVQIAHDHGKPGEELREVGGGSARR